MKEKVINLLARIHALTPLWLSGIYMPLVYFIRHLQTFILHFYEIEGKERESGIPLKILYFGRDDKIMKYWTRMLFLEESTISRGTDKGLWKIKDFILSHRNQQDLAIVELTQLTRKFIKLDSGFILPRWFDTMLDVENSLDAINNNDTHKHIKKHGFTFEERTSMEDLQYFYEKMFCPYITARHKESSVMVDYSYFVKRFNKKDSRLFFLLKDDTPVAGSFNERVDGMIKFSGLGILDGDRQVLRMGAVRALYYFMFNFYKETNTSTIYFGGTSPLLSDGLTQFKVSMRAFPNSKKLLGEKSLWIIPLSDSSPFHAVLKSNPFIFISGRKIYRAIFMESSEIERKKDLMNLLKKTHFRNIAGTKIYCRGDQARISGWLEEEEIQDTELVEWKLEFM